MTPSALLHGAEGKSSWGRQRNGTGGTVTSHCYKPCLVGIAAACFASPLGAVRSVYYHVKLRIILSYTKD